MKPTNLTYREPLTIDQHGKVVRLDVDLSSQVQQEPIQEKPAVHALRRVYEIIQEFKASNRPIKDLIDDLETEITLVYKPDEE